MKKFLLSIQEFEIIRTEDYLYVDKTEEMYQLLNAGRFLFLARPRRFGKSLLITIQQRVLST